MPTSNNQKAYLLTERDVRIECMFNPSELIIRRDAHWQSDDVPGRNAPNLAFRTGGSSVMQVDLLFDTTDDGSNVSVHTAKLLALTHIDTELPDYDRSTTSGRPPWVRFHWADFHSFKAVVDHLSITFTYFSSDGIPLRARAQVVLRQYQEDAAWVRQNPTSGTPRPHRTHVIQAGDTLDKLAAHYYGDPTEWRDIATANRIIDPLRLDLGAVLVIPLLERAAGHA